MTLVDFAARLDRSVGFVSQIERGLSEPSIEDLRNVARLFDVPISLFFGAPSDRLDERRHIVRAGRRRRLGSAEGGLIEELLSPDLSGSFEILRSEFAPGCRLSKAQQRDTEEAGYVVEGTLEMEFDGVWHTLYEGDSFRLQKEKYRWRNRTDQTVVVIWVIAPPVY